MSYPFYDLVNKQPDLKDIVEYLLQPIAVLEDIYKRASSLSHDYNNAEIIMQCEKIINHYLPNLINKYCEYSIEYRNTIFIKQQQTAKDILLFNIGKLTEEINLISLQFNKNKDVHS